MSDTELTLDDILTQRAQGQNLTGDLRPEIERWILADDVTRLPADDVRAAYRLAVEASRPWVALAKRSAG